MLVDREVLERDNKRLKARLRFAGLRQIAAPEDVDYRAHRGLDRALFQRLAQGEWIERQQNLLITGPTGVGKTWIACALGHRACRDNRSVLYQRVPRMLEGLGLARGDGRYARMLKSLARVQVLILDDWGLTPLTAEQRRDLLEIIDDRHGRTSTVVTSQLPILRRPAPGRRLPRMSITVRTAVSTAPCSSGWHRENGSNATQNLLITGPTGVGKTWLACALGHNSLLRQPLGALSARPAHAGGPRPGTRRRPLCPHAQVPRPRSGSDPR